MRICTGAGEKRPRLGSTSRVPHQLTVIHYDADFETAATVLRFQHRWVLPRGSV